MALKTVERITFSLPKVIIRKLEASVPKNSRSKFVAELISKNIGAKESTTLEDVHQTWLDLSKHYQPKLKKSSVELLREDRLSH